MKRVYMFILLVLISVFVLGGCQSGSSQNGSSGSPPPVPMVPPNAGGQSQGGDGGASIDTAIDYEDVGMSIQRELRKAFEKEPDQYLIGWYFTLNVIGKGKAYAEALDVVSLFENTVVTKHFNPYNVGKEMLSGRSGDGVFAFVGKTYDFKDANASESSVEALNSSHTSYKKTSGEIPQKDKVVIQYASIITTSKIVDFKNTVSIEGWESVNGKFISERLGPGFAENQKESWDSDISDGKIDTRIPQGDYKLTFEKPENEFTLPLDDDYIFIVGEEKPIEIKGLKKAKGYVYSGDESKKEKKPKAGANVELKSLITDAGIKGPFKATTDEDGYYEIEDVPLGKYIVLVDGKEMLTIIINEPRNNIKEVKDIYISKYNITVDVKGLLDDTHLEWKNVDIDWGSKNKSEDGSLNGLYLLTKCDEIDADVFEFKSTSYSKDMEMSEDYAVLGVYKGSEDTNKFSPNAYYFQWWYDIDFGDAEGMIIGTDGFGLTIFPENLEKDKISAKIPSDKIQELIKNGTPVIIEKTVDEHYQYKLEVKPQ